MIPTPDDFGEETGSAPVDAPWDKLMGEQARRLKPGAFCAYLGSLTQNDLPPAGHESWAFWIGTSLQLDDESTAFLPTFVLEEMHRRWADAWKHEVRITTTGVAARLHHRLSQNYLNSEAQQGAAFLVRHGAVLPTRFPLLRTYLAHAVERGWEEVAVALLDTGGAPFLDELLQPKKREKEAFRTDVLWSWLTNRQLLHPLARNGNFGKNLGSSTIQASMGTHSTRPVVPQWVVWAADGVRAARDWGAKHDPDRLEDADAWRCTRSIQRAQIGLSGYSDSNVVHLIRRHPYGVTGNRPGTGIPEACFVVAERPAAFDRMSDGDLSAFAESGKGNLLWQALVLGQGLTNARLARLERAGMFLNCDSQGHGLAMLLRFSTCDENYSEALEERIRSNPALVWGASEKHEAVWLAALEEQMYYRLANPFLLHTAQAHAHPETASNQLRGAWVLMTLLLEEGPSSNVACWVEMGVSIPSFFRQPLNETDEEERTPRWVVHRHPDWPFVEATLSNRDLEGTTPSSGERGRKPRL